MNTVTISAIVPTYNSGTTLARTIKSLEGSTAHTLEIIVADGGSVDETLDIAREQGAVTLPGVYRRSSARLEGARRAKGDYVLFIDSDQTAGPSLIDACLRAVRSGDRTAVVIPEIDLGAGLWFKCYAFERRLAAEANLVYPRFFRRVDYLSVGGHSTLLQDFMEDRELLSRWKGSGGMVALAETCIYNDLGQLNPLSLARKGAVTARDATAYYASQWTGQESPLDVVFPRLAAIVRSRVVRSEHLTTLLAFPGYLVLSRGPRLLLASKGFLVSHRSQKNSPGR